MEKQTNEKTEKRDKSRKKKMIEKPMKTVKKKHKQRKKTAWNLTKPVKTDVRFHVIGPAHPTAHLR